MMAAIYWAQALVPLALVAWLAFAPPRSALGFVVQLGATALALWLLGRTGLWMFPPWWAPHVLAVALLAAAAFGLARRRPVYRWPRSLPGWVGVLLFGGLAAHVLVLAPRVIAGASPPAGRIVDLAFPLAAGSYLVASGGSDLLLNAHRRSMLSNEPRFAPWRGNGYAVDIVALDRWGLRATGVMPPQPAAYRIFGKPLLAVCSGRVVAAVDGLADMRVPEYDRAHLAGNHVIVACGDVHVVMAHLRNGSVAVRAGDHVALGQRIGEVGNSGGSDEPHLHIHVQRPAPAGSAPMSGEPLPARFGGRFLVRGDVVTVH